MFGLSHITGKFVLLLYGSHLYYILAKSSEFMSFWDVICATLENDHFRHSWVSYTTVYVSIYFRFLPASFSHQPIVNSDCLPLSQTYSLWESDLTWQNVQSHLPHLSTEFSFCIKTYIYFDHRVEVNSQVKSLKGCEILLSLGNWEGKIK